MKNIQWDYGENDTQKFYEAEIGTDHLLVFCNKWQPDIWMAMINDFMIWDKTSNDRQRKKQGLAKGCDISMLKSSFLLYSPEPEYMQKKTAWCYYHNIREISK